MKIDLDEFGLDPDLCCYCGKEKTLTDRYGLPWCEQHQHRGQLLNWGLLQNFPRLCCEPFAIGAGEYCWYLSAVAGTDDLVWTTLSAIELKALPLESVPVAPQEEPPLVVMQDPTQEVTWLRKEARHLMSLMGVFFKEIDHQEVTWESSGKIHTSGKIHEKEYLRRVVNAVRIGDDNLLRDAIEAMQRTLGAGR